MSDEISQLSLLSSPATNDQLIILDVSDTTTAPAGPAGSNKRVLVSSVLGLGGGSVPGMQVIYMDALGADNTGSTSVTSLFNTQLSAKAGAPCLFVFGIGTYHWATAPNSLTTGQYVAGLGKGLTSFTWSGSGPLFTVNMSTSGWNGSGNAGGFSGFTIAGPYGSGGTAGIKYGAVQGLRIDDVGFFGLDGSAVIGYQVTASTDWAEESIFTRLDISGCGATSKSIFSFTTTSFDYTKIDAVIVVEAGIDIIAMVNGAAMQGLDLSLRGNLHGGTSNTGAVISIDRGNTAGTSNLNGGSFHVSMEGDGTSAGAAGNVGHYLLWMGSSNAASQFQAQGIFNVLNAGAPCQGTYNPNYLPASFSGTTMALNGGSVSAGAGLTSIGGSRWSPAGDGFGAAQSGQTVYWQFGDVFTFTLLSGANGTWSFQGTDSFVIHGTLYLKDPSSGTTPTLTLPGTWVTSTPTFTTTGKVHKIICDYLPTESTWYLQWVG